MTAMHASMQHTRANLDYLFAIDAFCSIIFGVVALLAPHGLWKELSAIVGAYNHDVHETLRYVLFCGVCESVGMQYSYLPVMAIHRDP
jgi:hypothetical protein